MRKHLTINNEGFTLVELMLALVVFAVGVLAVAQMQLTSMRYNTQAQQMSEATMLAQGKMDELMALGYGDTALDVGTVSEALSPPLSHYTITTTVGIDPETTAKAATKEIEVKVSWSSRGGDKKVILNCIKTELDGL